MHMTDILWDCVDHKLYHIKVLIRQLKIATNNSLLVSNPIT